jgi:hypothetical protein
VLLFSGQLSRENPRAMQAATASDPATDQRSSLSTRARSAFQPYAGGQAVDQVTKASDRAQSIRATKPQSSCGFVAFVTEWLPVHTSLRGFTTITQLLASNPTLPLVTRLALCSRPGAALLNVVASTLKSRETRLALSILADLRVKDPKIVGLGCEAHHPPAPCLPQMAGVLISSQTRQGQRPEGGDHR